MVERHAHVAPEALQSAAGRLDSVSGDALAAPHEKGLLTEAAWNYRFPARLGNRLRDRSKASAPDIRTVATHPRISV